MEITLHLKGYCIETAAKRRYEELVRELLKEDDKKKEEELEFLIEFLKNANFGELRKMGFDGSEEMFVKVKKVGNEFRVERV